MGTSLLIRTVVLSLVAGSLFGQPVVIKAGRVIDGRGRVLTNQEIVVEGGRSPDSLGPGPGVDPETSDPPNLLGDVVVCPAVASAEGTPIATLLVHGVLHLVGYDHETDGGAMLVRQDRLLSEVAPVVADPA